MHWLKIASILILIIGIIIFVAGLLVLYFGNPPYGTASALLIIGVLFLLGSIAMLCVSLQYDQKPIIEQIKEHQNTYYN